MARSGTAVPEIRAEAYYILGRSHHANGNMKAALPYYSQACKLWPSFALAQYRLAQAPNRILTQIFWLHLHVRLFILSGTDCLRCGTGCSGSCRSRSKIGTFCTRGA